MRHEQRDDINQRIRGVGDDTDAILERVDSSSDGDKETVAALCALTKAVLLVAEIFVNTPNVYKEITR